MTNERNLNYTCNILANRHCMDTIYIQEVCHKINYHLIVYDMARKNPIFVY